MKPKVLIITGSLVSYQDKSLFQIIKKQIDSLKFSSGAWQDIQQKISASKNLLSQKKYKTSAQYQKRAYYQEVESYFNNQHNVWIYSPQTGKESELIVRSGRILKRPRLDYEAGELYYLENDVIKAIEIDGQVTRNVEEFTDEKNAVQNFSLTADGKRIYYLVEGQGLFSV